MSDDRMTEADMKTQAYRQVDAMASAGKVVELTEAEAWELGVDTLSEPCMPWQDAMDARFDDVAP